MRPQSAPIRILTGKGIPLPGNDIDTDRIIPARFMRCISFDGLGDYAFFDEQRDSEGALIAHPFNDPRFADHEILIVNKNFGCGSSREHAPQALARRGVRALVGESFADIFAGNCTAMGIPAVTAEERHIARLMDMVSNQPDIEIDIDLDSLLVTAGDASFAVSLPDAARQSLLSGMWDTTASLAEGDAEIAATAARLPYLSGFSD
jgi:3-isopropylmalate/(R)-2-methylmalate dehydratase small subunit